MIEYVANLYSLSVISLLCLCENYRFLEVVPLKCLSAYSNALTSNYNVIVKITEFFNVKN